MKADVSYYSSIGGRIKNEDCVSLLENKNHIVATVADGLGGHELGEVASRLAVAAINEALINKSLSEDKLEAAISKANSRILSGNKESKMKTTVAVAWIDETRVLFSTVGDTRIYMFRNNKIVFQSVDHSVSQMAVMVGEITSAQIRGHKDRNKLIRVLGSVESVKPDINEFELQKGDAILMCTDGFWENIIESEMINILSHSQTAGSWLTEMRKVAESVMSVKGDNHSAVAIIIN